MFSPEDMYNKYFIANQIYYSRSKYTSNYTRGHIRYHWKNVGDEILIYVHIYIQRIQLQEQLEGNPRETLTKYETRELDPKIDHKISSTNGPKEIYSKI
jgi:hypothetical protein